MNRNFFISGGMLVLSLIISGTCLPEVAAAKAVYSSTVTAAVVPTEAQLRAAIAEIEALDGYDRFAGLSATELAQATPFAEEYTYLANLVATGRTTLAQFTTTSQDYLRDLYRALTDAAKGCRLIFGAAQRPTTNSSAAQTTTSAAPADTTSRVATEKNATPTRQTQSATTAATNAVRVKTHAPRSAKAPKTTTPSTNLNPASVARTVTTSAAAPVEKTVTVTSHTLALARPVRPQVS